MKQWQEKASFILMEAWLAACITAACHREIGPESPLSRSTSTLILSEGCERRLGAPCRILSGRAHARFALSKAISFAHARQSVGEWHFEVILFHRVGERDGLRSSCCPDIAHCYDLHGANLLVWLGLLVKNRPPTDAMGRTTQLASPPHEAAESPLAIGKSIHL